MTNTNSRTGRLSLWLGVILLAFSEFIWLMLILGTALDPKIDLTSVIAGGVFITFIPIGLGIYCLTRATKPRPTLEPPPFPQVDITVPEEIPSVTKIEKIAYLEKQTAHLEKQIKTTRRKRFAGFLCKEIVSDFLSLFLVSQ